MANVAPHLIKKINKKRADREDMCGSMRHKTKVVQCVSNFVYEHNSHDVTYILYKLAGASAKDRESTMSRLKQHHLAPSAVFLFEFLLSLYAKVTPFSMY